MIMECFDSVKDTLANNKPNLWRDKRKGPNHMFIGTVEKRIFQTLASLKNEAEKSLIIREMQIKTSTILYLHL